MFFGKKNIGILGLFLLVSAVLSGQDSLNRIRLIFVGDIMGHGPQIEAAMVEKDKLYDYTPCFEYVAPLLREYDLAIGNLELTLPGKPPYTGYPTFKSPDDLAVALRGAGFDLLVTANNHSNDGGLNGVLNTIKTVQQNGFFQTGTFADSLQRKALYPLIVYQGNFKLAFLNYTYGTNGIPTPKPAVINLIDETAIAADMAVARALRPDAIIVLLHWGAEYQLTENTAQRQLAQKVLEWGADVVIGAHPHVVQPIKNQTVSRPDGSAKTGLVVYSLGNFISAQTKTYTNLGLMVGMEWEKNLYTQQTRCVDVHYLPVYRHIQRLANGRSQYLVLPVSAFENAPENPLQLSEATRQAMKTVANTIRNNLNAHGAKERKISLEDLLNPKE